MKKLIKSVIILMHLFLVIQANAQEVQKNSSKSTRTHISLNNEEQKRVLKKFYYKNGTLKEEREVLHGKLDGFWKFYYSSGKLKKEGRFKNNKANGIWKRYKEDGSLAYIERYINGVEEGEWKAFYPNGTLRVIGSFSQGKRQGEWAVYTKEGYLDRKITFKDDRIKNEIRIARQQKTTSSSSYNMISTLD